MMKRDPMGMETLTYVVSVGAILVAVLFAVAVLA
jgi:hypothetical protein